MQDVQHHPCTEAHDGEVYLIANTDLESYPLVFGFDKWASEHCLGVPFESYVGQPAEERLDIDVGYFAPTREGWEGGDREMTCYLTPADGGTTTQSYKGAAAPAAS